TSVDAAAKALSTFERGVRLILGGTDKGAPYTPLMPLIQERVKSVYVIGAATEKIAADLAGADLHEAGDLETAVKMAFQSAISSDVVLLSPSCSSYDQFNDFEERGHAFKEAVKRLAQSPTTQIQFPAPLQPQEMIKAQTGPVNMSSLNMAVPDHGISIVSKGSANKEDPLAGLPSEPVYVYEVDREETPLADQTGVEQDVQDIAEGPAAGFNGAVIEEYEPPLPYEIPAAAGAATSGLPVDGGTQTRDTGTSGGSEKAAQQTLFKQELEDKS
ncbi:MAG: glutamate ligase domain-containing protein, partial [Terriglobia bacterium]